MVQYFVPGFKDITGRMPLSFLTSPEYNAPAFDTLVLKALVPRKSDGENSQ